MVPGVLIDKDKFIICLYNCEIDCLIVSEAISFSQNTELSVIGLIALWLVVHHDKTLLFKDCDFHFPSTILEKLHVYGRYNLFSELNSMDIKQKSFRLDKLELVSSRSTFNYAYASKDEDKSSVAGRKRSLDDASEDDPAKNQQ